MPQTTFLERKARVLGERVATVRRQERRRHPRLIGLGVAMVAAVACFFVLKGATLAHYGTDGFTRIMSPITAGEGMAGLRWWIGGIDPVTQTIARTFDPSFTPAPMPPAEPGA